MVAPNTSSLTNIKFPQSPFLDSRTGYPAKEWIVWLQNPSVVSSTVNYQILNGGEINNTTIGLTIPAAGKFTDLTALNGIGGGTF